jgi:hypothetical protein
LAGSYYFRITPTFPARNAQRSRTQLISRFDYHHRLIMQGNSRWPTLLFVVSPSLMAWSQGASVPGTAPRPMSPLQGLPNELLLLLADTIESQQSVKAFTRTCRHIFQVCHRYQDQYKRAAQWGWHPLSISARQGYGAVVKLLLERRGQARRY